MKTNQCRSIQINDLANYSSMGPFHEVVAEASRRGLNSVNIEVKKGCPTGNYRFSEMYNNII